MPGIRPDIRLIRKIATGALGVDLEVEAVDEGVSTYVYRLTRGADIFYLRVLPEVAASFAPEAEAHEILRRHGVSAPEVVYWEDGNGVVARSVMITTEIKGRSIGQARPWTALPGILRSAGRDLAVVNLVPVHGFGWVRREPGGGGGLRGGGATEREFMLADLDSALHMLAHTLLEKSCAHSIRGIVRDLDALLDSPQARLAHGDFDVTHIFCHEGRYTGILDLGEIRGAGPFYDLGHFRFHDGETIPITLLPYLLEGYGEVAPLGPDADRRIAFQSLLIGIRFLARTYQRLDKRHRLHAVAAIEREAKVLSG